MPSTYLYCPHFLCSPQKDLSPSLSLSSNPSSDPASPLNSLEPLDATLDMCCQRDREESRRVAAIKSQLRAWDPTLKVHAARQPTVLPHPTISHHDDDNGDDDESSFASDHEGDADDSVATHMWRDARLRELQRAQAERVAVAARFTLGGGTLTTRTPDDLLTVLQQRTGDTVMHIHITGSSRRAEDAAEGDETLAQYARERINVSVVTCPTSTRSEATSLLQQLGLGERERSHAKGWSHMVLQCLLAARNGAVIACLSLAEVGAGMEGGVRGEEEVERWLRRWPRRRRGKVWNIGCRVGGVSESDSEYDSTDDDDIEDGEGCSTCGRTGFHVHVPAVGPEESRS